MKKLIFLFLLFLFIAFSQTIAKVIGISDVLEIWEYECSINRDDLGLWNNSQPDVQAMFLSLKNDIQILKNQIENR